LIGASNLSFTDIGGVNGLIKSGVFPDKASLCRLLSFLDGYTIVDDIIDGFFEALVHIGFDEMQYQAVVDIGLVEFLNEPYVLSEDEQSHFEQLSDDDFIPESVGWFELTQVGKAVVQGLDQNTTQPYNVIYSRHHRFSSICCSSPRPITKETAYVTSLSDCR
jgi:hypothetical protein